MKSNLFKILILFILVIKTTHVVQAQMNTKSHTLRFLLNGSMNLTSTNKVYLFNNILGYTYEVEKMELNANAKWVYGYNSLGLTNNDFRGTLDGNYYHDIRKRFNSWIVTNYNSSYSLGILNEYQTGVGVAYKFLDTVGQQFIYLKLSSGALVEKSDFFNSEKELDVYNTIRMSFRLQFRVYLFNRKAVTASTVDNVVKGSVWRMNFESTTFWQPAINRAGDYNFTTVLALNVPLTKNTNFQSRFEYNYITRTLKENMLWTFGVNTRLGF